MSHQPPRQVSLAFGVAENGAVRVLWVENHAVFARMAGRLFLATHELTVVSSVTDALAALAAQAFDAVLVDYDLDNGKGDVVVEHVRQLPTRPAVIATSSHDGGNAALVSAGADALCSKARFAEIATALASAV